VCVLRGGGGITRACVCVWGNHPGKRPSARTGTGTPQENRDGEGDRARGGGEEGAPGFVEDGLMAFPRGQHAHAHIVEELWMRVPVAHRCVKGSRFVHGQIVTRQRNALAEHIHGKECVWNARARCRRRRAEAAARNSPRPAQATTTRPATHRGESTPNAWTAKGWCS